jgi:hypothetical protein
LAIAEVAMEWIVEPGGVELDTGRGAARWTGKNLSFLGCITVCSVWFFQVYCPRINWHLYISFTQLLTHTHELHPNRNCHTCTCLALWTRS